jgi:hypothetical protein
MLLLRLIGSGSKTAADYTVASEPAKISPFILMPILPMTALKADAAARIAQN